MDPILQEQIDYYRARAGEYDEWFFRQGRYDQGPALNARWRSELDEISAMVEASARHRRVLELAGGTGIWTQHLARVGEELTVVDASPEMLAINRDRVRNPHVRYIETDLFMWQPDTVYDVVFFGFWVSHVPPQWFGPFWSLVGRCLVPGGRAVFVDNLRPSTSASDRQPVTGQMLTTRELNDGRQFRIYKRFYLPAELKHALKALSWHSEIRATSTYFAYGWAQQDTRAEPVCHDSRTT
jgi:ubiquinone/menaquinone biosynthesis C-methylase UbiE